MSYSKTLVGILCGGKGKRIADISKGTPKCLLNFRGQPVLSHILRELNFAARGSQVTLLCGPFAFEFGKFVDEYESKFDCLSLETCPEASQEGTARAISKWLSISSNPAYDNVLVLNGDTLLQGLEVPSTN